MSPREQTGGTSRRPILRVSFAHDFYEGEFRGLHAVPFPETARICRRLGLQLRAEAPGLALYARSDFPTDRMLAGYQADLAAAKLCWQLVPEPAEFSAVTQPAFAAQLEVLVLTPAEDDPSQRQLTVHTHASPLDLWPRRPLCFEVRRPGRPIASDQPVLLGTGGGQALKALTVTDPRLLAVDVKTPGYGSGPYRMEQGRHTLARWFADERCPAATGPGPVLVLPGSHLRSAHAQVLSKRGSSPATPVYTAAFRAREVIWRYHVFNSVADEFLAIEAAHDHPGTHPRKSARSATPSSRIFQEAPATITGARTLQSTRPLPLRRRQPERFRLLSDGVKRFSPLPLPPPPGGIPDFADMFIYL